MAFYECSRKENTKKKRLMYFKHPWNGTLNPAGVAGNNLISYDASILPNYQKLTVDNFEFLIKSVKGQGENSGVSGYKSEFSKTYDPNTGIFTMKTTGTVSGYWVGISEIEGYLYLVEPMEEEILPIKCSLSNTISNTSTTGGIKWVNSYVVDGSHTKFYLKDVVIGTSSNENYNYFKVIAINSNGASLGDLIVAKYSDLHLNEYVDIPEGTTYLRAQIQIYSSSSITTSGSFIVE